MAEEKYYYTIGTIHDLEIETHDLGNGTTIQGIEFKISSIPEMSVKLKNGTFNVFIQNTEEKEPKKFCVYEEESKKFFCKGYEAKIIDADCKFKVSSELRSLLLSDCACNKKVKVFIDIPTDATGNNDNKPCEVTKIVSNLDNPNHD